MQRICLIPIFVSNMELAIQFYCEKLGLEVSREYEESIVKLKHEDIPIVLYEVGKLNQVNYPKHSQTVLGIQTDNLVDAIAELSAQGIEMIYDTPQPCFPGYYSAFKDPFGNVIEILEFS
ncbi:VOC family protein [Paenibacillus antarcticus]|uniref:Glyoxalase n=1 Tax=Paenibacillus antarcticus TaxID=253703 RepID=A0A162PXZ1_9BACL|nr:VOC family protein [Paenibacillus antarcticus]OAB40310.1 glyoxalase [Paenibacillus antarcticus]